MVCSKCQAHLSNNEVDYSTKHYGKLLCRECQKQYAPLENKHEQRKSRSTPQAIKLHDALIKIGFNAKLEQWDGHKHIDIAIPDKKINIEVDGPGHIYSNKQAIADIKRTFYSWRKGYVTLRIPNQLIDEDAYKAVGCIKEFLEMDVDKLKEE